MIVSQLYTGLISDKQIVTRSGFLVVLSGKKEVSDLNDGDSIMADKGFYQGRNEVYGIRDRRPVKRWDQGSQAGIWDHSTWDRDQQRFSWNQGSGYPRR